MLKSKQTILKGMISTYAGFYTGFFPEERGGGEWHYYHSVRSMPILGGSGGMLPQENF